MSIGFPTGDWCCSPSSSKTTPNMFKGRLNRAERFPEHNRGAAYISATRSALFSARFMWEDGCWRVGPKKKQLCKHFQDCLMRQRASQSDVAATTEHVFRNKDKLTDWIIHFHAAPHADWAWHRAFDQLVDRLSNERSKKRQILLSIYQKKQK